MNILTIALLPLAATAALVAAAALLGRPPRRYTLNLVLGVLLFVYFGATSALGIFWVAEQELPVFDVHYVFGYLTVILVLIHVAVNWKPLSHYARKLSPRAFSSDGRRWRPAVRIGAALAGLAVVACTGYWYGHGAGATTIHILTEAPTSGEAARSGTTPTREGYVRSASVVPRQFVDPDDGEPQPVADYFHTRTKYTHDLLDQDGPPLNWATQPSIHKQYETGELVPLPTQLVAVDMPTGEAITRRRRSIAALEPVDVSLEQLSTLLHLTNGKTKETARPGRAAFSLRAAPSAGALYPTVTYVLVERVAGLSPGLYHYDVQRHALRLLRAAPSIIGDLADVSAHSDVLRGASFALVFTADFYRSSWKYGERSWRYSLMDTGHVAVNAMTAIAGLGWDSVPIGRFDDAAVNRLLDVEPGREQALLLVAVGAAKAAGAPRDELAFAASPDVHEGGPVPALIQLAQGMTRLQRSDEPRVAPFPTPALLEPRFEPEPTSLSAPTETGAPLFETIQKRRSRRNWKQQGMSMPQLSSLMYHSFGLRNGAPDPSVERNRALRLYVIVLAAGGVEPGVYEYLRHDHALSRIKTGGFRGEAFTSNLYQELARDAGLVLVQTIDTRAMAFPDGDRGYRYAALDAGMLGGRVYLQAEALGLGACGIGAFFDDDISNLVGLEPSSEHVIYTLAVGVPSE